MTKIVIYLFNESLLWRLYRRDDEDDIRLILLLFNFQRSVEGIKQNLYGFTSSISNGS